jgi:hypothetical protein
MLVNFEFLKLIIFIAPYNREYIISIIAQIPLIKSKTCGILGNDAVPFRGGGGGFLLSPKVIEKSYSPVFNNKNW